MKNTKTFKIYLAASIYAIIVGLSFLFNKVGLKYSQPLDLLAYRFTFALIAVTNLIKFGFIKTKFNLETFKLILPFSLFYPLLSFGFQIFGQNLIQSSEAGLNFYELDISKNKNIQKAESTDQPDSEKERLEEFFQATRKGAVETLMTQSRHRKDDMLYDPHTLIKDIETIDDNVAIDSYVVDVLSYSVTLALYSLNLKFITFCPPHPIQFQIRI